MKLGIVVNPLAGLGGPAALKGSDGANTVQTARARGVQSQIANRIEIMWAELMLQLTAFGLADCQIVCAEGDMGSAYFKTHTNQVLLELEIPSTTTASDTQRIAAALEAHGVDVLLFVGGDGTARDVHDAVSATQVVLGLPCGVKMHSGVFANNPKSAGRVLSSMIKGELVSVATAEVRDIDEQAFRDGVVKARHYGELLVPEEIRYMQQVKSGGVEVEAIVIEEIAADVVDKLDSETTYFIGSGSTTARIMNQLGLDNTLLGVDVIRAGEVIIKDAHEQQLFELSRTEACHAVITVIGGQGHIFGRGNQQFSPRVIRAIGRSNFTLIATKTKLENLVRLHVDTGDAELDEAFDGFIKVTTGYDDAVLCPVSAC
jgi:predicted polyphosphate/ATP-dependent NAD kinase